MKGKGEGVRKRNQEGVVGGRVGDPPGEGKRGGLGVGRYAAGIDRGARPDFPARKHTRNNNRPTLSSGSEKTEEGRGGGEEAGTTGKQITHHLGGPEGGPWTERKGWWGGKVKEERGS